MRILVATDGSEAALRACRIFTELVGRNRAEVRVLTVLSFDMYPYALVAGEHLADEAQMEEKVRDKVEQTTRDSERLFADAGYPVAIRHRFGNAGDEIISEIDEWQPDVVVIGRRGLRGLARWLGSVSEHVIHRSKVPILVVP